MIKGTVLDQILADKAIKVAKYVQETDKHSGISEHGTYHKSEIKIGSKKYRISLFDVNERDVAGRRNGCDMIEIDIEEYNVDRTLKGKFLVIDFGLDGRCNYGHEDVSHEGVVKSEVEPPNDSNFIMIISKNNFDSFEPRGLEYGEEYQRLYELTLDNVILLSKKKEVK